MMLGQGDGFFTWGLAKLNVLVFQPLQYSGRPATEYFAHGQPILSDFIEHIKFPLDRFLMYYSISRHTVFSPLQVFSSLRLPLCQYYHLPWVIIRVPGLRRLHLSSQDTPPTRAITWRGLRCSIPARPSLFFLFSSLPFPSIVLPLRLFLTHHHCPQTMDKLQIFSFNVRGFNVPEKKIASPLPHAQNTGPSPLLASNAFPGRPCPTVIQQIL